MSVAILVVDAHPESRGIGGAAALERVARRRSATQSGWGHGIELSGRGADVRERLAALPDAAEAPSGGAWSR